MPPGSHYIDFTGSGLYTNSQLAAASAELASHVYGNPHCTSPSSLMVDEELKEARDMVLRHFSADPREYAVVFTRCGGHTGAGQQGWAATCCGSAFVWWFWSTLKHLREPHSRLCCPHPLGSKGSAALAAAMPSPPCPPPLHTFATPGARLRV
jgi:hypothetical protein